MRRGPVPLMMHEAIEPVAAVLLIASSWIFDFSSNSTAQAVTIVVGAIMLVSGSLTDWRLSLARLIPLRAHFMTDLVLGLVLVVSPFVFGFSGNGGATRFAVIFGALEMLTALATRWDTAEDAPGRASRVSGAQPAR
jgi:SPW repeat-containing protein